MNGNVKQICAMPQYDDSFLLDCEKQKNARSYKPHKQFAISNGKRITKPLQNNGTIGKWRKIYFTFRQNASPSHTTATTTKPTALPIYRSMCSLVDNSTFNCKFNNGSQLSVLIHSTYIYIQLNAVAFDIQNAHFMHQCVA